MPEVIRVTGAREHNLKNISVEIPRDKLVVITGLSGSGKSSLAFDTIYAEGQRRYVESLSSYARQFLGIMEKPDVDQLMASVLQSRLIKSPPAETRAVPLQPSLKFMIICDSYLLELVCRTVRFVAKQLHVVLHRQLLTKL